jgi:AcrR family transcriptional regulator
MASPRTHDAELRRRLLAETGRIVSERGVSGLSLRALASAESTSTTAVYSLFGGKVGLLTALFVESCESFGAAQKAATRTGDWLADILSLGWAYWDWAMENAHRYQVMFGGSLAGVEIDPQLLAWSYETLTPLSELVAVGVERGLVTGDPAVITQSVWSTVHGAVSLTLAGCVPFDPDTQRRLYDETVRNVVRGWTLGPDHRGES